MKRDIYTIEDGFNNCYMFEADKYSKELRQVSIFDACKELTNLDDNAARFIEDWYPEYTALFVDMFKYGAYSWITFEQATEDELTSFLNYHGVTEKEYDERYGSIIRDAAFDGVIIVGE